MMASTNTVASPVLTTMALRITVLAIAILSSDCLLFSSGESGENDDVIYVDCANGIPESSCWEGGPNMPCANLDLALEGVQQLERLGEEQSFILLNVTQPKRCRSSFELPRCNSDDATISGSGDTDLSVAGVENKTCPTWFFPVETNDTVECKCGAELGGIVYCSDRALLLLCYCMTYDTVSQQAVVGACFFSCFDSGVTLHRTLPTHISELGGEFCKQWHRQGLLCSQCEDGFSPPVYSYNLSCVGCPSSRPVNWIKYLVTAYVPLTVFFIAIVVLRISITAAALNSFVLVCQVIAIPANVRIALISVKKMNVHSSSEIFHMLVTFYGIWNLDFFRTLYTPFCLMPGMSTMQVLALDYAIALYPLVLILATYACIELHAHDFKIFVCLWRPFHKCFVRLRRSWDVRSSIVDAFTTFILLSYVKFTSVTFDLVLVTRLRTVEGTVLRQVAYYDANIGFFSKEHLPFLLPAVCVFLLFVVIPPIILILHPLKCIHKRIKCFRQSRILHTFVESFQGCYKDGTNGTYDCRYFSAVYMALRVAVLFIYTLTLSVYFYPIAAILFIITATSVALIQPYKSSIYNIIDAVLFNAVAIMYIVQGSLIIPESRYTSASLLMSTIAACVPLIYISILLVYLVFVKKLIPQKIYRKIRALRLRTMRSGSVSEEEASVLPDRILHPKDYLLRSSVHSN